MFSFFQAHWVSNGPSFTCHLANLYFTPRLRSSIWCLLSGFGSVLRAHFSCLMIPRLFFSSISRLSEIFGYAVESPTSEDDAIVGYYYYYLDLFFILLFDLWDVAEKGEIRITRQAYQLALNVNFITWIQLVTPIVVQRSVLRERHGSVLFIWS